MKKQKIAVIFGGNSTEYEVSLQSATAVLKNINSERFDILPIGINRAGDWFHYSRGYSFNKLSPLLPEVQTRNFN